MASTPLTSTTEAQTEAPLPAASPTLSPPSPISPTILRRASSTPNLRDLPHIIRPISPPSANTPLATLASTSSTRPPPITMPVPAPSPPVAPPPPTPANAAPEARRVQGGWWTRFKGYFGYGANGDRNRRELTTLIIKLIGGVAQIAIIATFLAIGTVTPSPTQPTLSEWEACERPLGAWSAIWCVRVGFGCIMAIWQWRRSQTAATSNEQDAGNIVAPGNPNSPPGVAPTFPPANPTTPAARPTNTASARRQARIFSQLSTLVTLLSLTWFLTAHVLVYTSLNTCRNDSPHIWWLAFGIMCLGYLVVLEVFVVAMLVFVIGPFLFLILNLILLCLGRPPIQPAHINPDVPKLSQKMVDRIPLVLYIPPPPTAEPSDGKHVYPPPALGSVEAATDANDSAPPAPQKKHRFAFLRRSKKNKDSKGKGKEPDLEKGPTEDSGAESADDWEGQWEKGEFPFVKLEGNRASCAICLMDFEQPAVRVKRSRKVATDAAAAGKDAEPASTSNQADNGEISVVPVSPSASPSTMTPGERRTEDLRLEDAGGGAQPLRLLACGHAFHKTCLDPWLLDVSGRCPICQRKVEIEFWDKEKKKRRLGGLRRGSSS